MDGSDYYQYRGSLFQCVILVGKNKEDFSGALEQNHTLVELRFNEKQTSLHMDEMAICERGAISKTFPQIYFDSDLHWFWSAICGLSLIKTIKLLSGGVQLGDTTRNKQTTSLADVTPV